MDMDTINDNDDEEEFAAMIVVENMTADTHFMLQLILTVVNFMIASFFKSRRKKATKYSMHARIPSQVNNLARLVGNSDKVCVDELRMNMRTFRILCEMIRNVGGVAHSKYVSLEEKVAIFLFVLAHHTKNRLLQYIMQRSGQTISHYFHEILGAVLMLHNQLLVRPDPVPPNSPDWRWNIFEGCLRALDGTYIPVRVGDEDKVRYRSRKGEIAINVLGVVDRNMNFTFILSGWEGSAADGRVLRDAITRVDGLKIPTEMESASTKEKRRTWSKTEEQKLIACLKSMCADHAWKSTDGSRDFKKGYIYQLEKDLAKDLAELLPGTDLKAVPHIESKIKTWKISHKVINGLASQIGVGWDDNPNMIIVDTEEDWQVYLKKEPDAKRMRGKSFELYKEWKEIWEVDRANGVDSETPTGVAENIRANVGLVDEHDMEVEVDGLEDISPSGSDTRSRDGKNKDLASGSSGSKWKRKRDDGSEGKRKRDGAIQVMANQISETIITGVNILADTQMKNMTTICTRLGHEVDKSEKRRNFPTLLKELNLSEDDELDVISIMGTDDKQIDLFMGFSESQRVKWVRRLLERNFRAM